MHTHLPHSRFSQLTDISRRLACPPCNLLCVCVTTVSPHHHNDTIRFWMSEAQTEVLVEPETLEDARETPLGERVFWHCFVVPAYPYTFFKLNR